MVVKKETETQVHLALIEYMTWNRIPHHHSPNELQLMGVVRQHLIGALGEAKGRQLAHAIAVRYAGRNKQLGTVTGWPDIDLPKVPPNYPESTGAHLEVKSSSGRISQAQHDQLDILHGLGRRVAVVDSVEAGIAKLIAWGYCK